jgi:cyclohexanecarboxylate-CoA ligase
MSLQDKGTEMLAVKNHGALHASAVWDLVADRAAATPTLEFAVDEHGRRFTFEECQTLSEGIAATLHARGVRAGDVVSWQLPNTVEAMCMSLALSRLGAVQNPVIPMFRDAEVEFITNQVGASLLIVPREFRGYDHGQMAERVRKVVPGLDVLVLEETGDYSGWELGDPSNLPTVRTDVDADAIAWIFYTSGTTAAPKGVKHTDRGLLAASMTFVSNLEVTQEDRCAAFVPIAHVGGIAHMLHSLLVGHSLIISAAFAPEANADQLIEEKATLVGSGLPFTNEYLRLSRERGIAPLFPHSRATLGGGSGRPAGLSGLTKEHLGGVGIISGYGMTECPYITWGTPHDTDEQHAEFEGIPGSGGQVRIVGAGESIASVGEIGEIRVRGPQLFHGYVDSSLDSSAFDTDGFFRTGDLGFLDQDGRLAVTGRIKDIIVRKMENISAREVEEALMGDPSIADLTVIGVPDSKSGERVCAVVVAADPGNSPTLESVQKYLRITRLNVRKFPEQVEVVEAIPRNPLGKISKPELQKRYSKDITDSNVEKV